jgi:dTDP-4-amino-4,6-dideoxygalactose transaminase
VRHAKTYAAELEGVGDLRLQQVAAKSTHVYHLFVVETDHRDALREYLTGRGILTGIHYPVPIHLQKAYSELGLTPGAFPTSERLARQTLSLPMYPELTSDQIEFTTSTIRAFFGSFGSRT